MSTKIDAADKRTALRQLGLWGLLASWEEIHAAPWLEPLIAYERAERQRRSLERRTRNASLKTFKPLCDFDWQWPRKIDRAAIDELCSLEFITERANVVLIGPNSCGKTMIAKNLAHLALLAGYSVRFVSAAQMLGDLAARDSASSLNRRLGHYCRPPLLVCDELGYLSHNARYADLLFEVVSRRYEQAATVITTNRPFADWGEVFPNASSVVTIIDRLIHKAEIITIEADSYRLKEAKERAASKAKARKQRSASPRKSS
jgi:DNA replication protein DnaC